MNDLYIMHYGVGHDKGGHSGRYPWGSGKNPKQDLRLLKRNIKSNYDTARRKQHKLEGKHPLWWREHYGSILSDAGIHTVFGGVRMKNRPAVKMAVEKRLKTNPEFKKAVQEAKQEWARVGKDISETGKSFCDYYKNKEPDPRFAKAGKAVTDKYARFANRRANMSDAEFATTYLFDEHRAENKARIAIAGAFAAQAGYYAYQLYKEVK